VNGHSNTRHYTLNLLSSYGTTFLSIVIGVVSAPMALSYWKVEQYGVWTTIISFSTYLSVSGLGIDVAAGILMTKTSNAGSKRAIFRKSMFLVCFSASMLLVLVITVHAVVPGWARIIGHVSPSSVATAKNTTFVFVLAFLVNLPFGVIGNSLAAYQRAYVQNMFSSLSAFLGLIVLVVTILFRMTMPMFAVFVGLSTLAMNVVKLFTFLRIRSNYERTSSTDPLDQNSETSAKILIRTGFELLAYGSAVTFVQSLGNVIISNKIDMAHVTPYALTYRLLFLGFTLVTTINLSAAPLLGREYSRGNWPWIASVHARLLSITCIVGGAVWIGAILFLKSIILLWVGPNGYAGAATVVLLGGWIYLSGLSNINFVVINSFNFTKGIGLLSWIELAVFVVATEIFIGPFGISGVALALMASQLLVSVWALPLIVHRRSERRIGYPRGRFILLSFVVIVGVIASAASNWLIRAASLRFVIALGICFSYAVAMYWLLPGDVRRRFGVAALYSRFLGR